MRNKEPVNTNNRVTVRIGCIRRCSGSFVPFKTIIE